MSEMESKIISTGEKVFIDFCQRRGGINLLRFFHNREK
jgi:hypothetical protein